MIKHPAEIRIGDTVIFDVPSFANSIGTTIDNTYTLTWYGRTNTAEKGASVTATNQGDGWRVTIPSTTTADWVAGDWYFQLVAVSGFLQYLAGEGQFKAIASLAYAGTPGAFDGRSRAQVDLDQVQAAIRTILDGGAVQSYSIAGRNLSKYALADLLALETKLKAEVKREQTADLIRNGHGNPHNLFVRF